MKSIRKIMRPLIIIICFIVIFNCINDVVGHSKEDQSWLDNVSVKEIYKLEPNSIDVLAMGPSISKRSFNTMKVYEDYGISSYNSGMARQPIVMTYLMLKEILKTQKPKVLLLESVMPFFEPQDTLFRTSFDGMKWSPEKLKILFDLPDTYITDSYISYLFPIVNYHSRITEITKSDFVESAKEDYMFWEGYKPAFGQYKPSTPMKSLSAKNTGKMGTMDEVAETYLYKIIDLCKANDIPIVIYKGPMDIGAEEAKWCWAYHNTVQKIADENEIPFIDFNIKETADACGLDFTTDQNDKWHQNYYGSLKVTQYLEDYLKEHYDIPDRRNDPKYAFLDKELVDYKRVIFNTELRKKNIQETINLIKSEKNHEFSKDYTIIIATKDRNPRNLTEITQNDLNVLGFNFDFSNQMLLDTSYIGIWQGGKVIYENWQKDDNTINEYRGVLLDGMKYYVSNDESNHIIINGEEEAKADKNVNIIIYDNVKHQIIYSPSF